MRYVISYDLSLPEQDYEALYEALEERTRNHYCNHNGLCDKGTPPRRIFASISSNTWIQMTESSSSPSIVKGGPLTTSSTSSRACKTR